MNVSKARNSAIAAAVATALGSAGAAYAVNLTNPAVVFYMAGGSAEPQPVQAAVCQLLSNVDSITDAAGTISATNDFSSDYLILEGTATNTIGSIAAGTEVMVMYKFNGGSYLNGAQSFGSGAGTLSFPTVSSVITGVTAIASGTTTNSGGPGTACTQGDGGPTYQQTTAYSLGAQTPSVGITDLEVAAFSGDNNPNAPAALVNPVNPHPGYDLVEGIAVNDKLFQVKSNFTTAEVKAILSGFLTDWHDFTGNNGQPVAEAHTGIVLIDRNVGSGTKTAGSAFFLGYPWLGAFELAPGSATFGYTGSGSATTRVGISHSGPGQSTKSGGIPSGYVDFMEGNSALVVEDLQTCNASTAPVYCIAVLSADNAPYLNQVGGANTYDFVSIDGTYVDTNATGSDSLNDPSGAGSTFKNVILGNYGFYYQVSVQTQSGLTGTNAALEAALLPLLTTNASAIAGITQKKKFPVAAPSIVLDPDNLSAVTANPAAGTVLQTRSANSDNVLAQSPELFGATLTFNNDPL
jgi:hypothetical protein